MKSFRNTCRLLLAILLSVLHAQAYTSRRKKVDIAPSEGTTIASPHEPLHTAHLEPNKASDVHRRLSEKPNADHPDAKNSETSAIAADLKPTIQKIDGTIVKDDMNRGPPLAKQLPEDEDDWVGWDDDEWYEDDKDKTYEEKLADEQDSEDSEDEPMGSGEELEDEEDSEDSEDTENAVHEEAHVEGVTVQQQQQQQQQETKEVQEEAKGEVKEEIKHSEQQPQKGQQTLQQTTQQQQQQAKQTQTQQATKQQPARKKKIRPPRVYESNAEAVMKIIDTDANPEIRINEEGEIISDSEDGETEDETYYIGLPNMATLNASEAAYSILNATIGMTMPLRKRLTEVFEKATTHECRAKIAEHYALHINAIGVENKLPFEDFYYPNTCKAITRYADWETLPEGVTAQSVQYRTYQPDVDSVPEGTYLKNVDELELCYVILTHDQPEATIRLIQSLYVADVTTFVIHVDGKEKSDETYERLVKYAAEMNEYLVDVEGKAEYIRIVPNENRVRVNWGGFTMVKATLMALHTAFGLDYYAESEDEEGGDVHDNPHAFRFHKLVHIASTTYPLASNTEIRDTLVSHPLDANFFHIILRPNNPTPSVWNYFVECDDALHRIYRLPALNFDRGNGVDIYTSSQWFIASRDFAWYLAAPPKGSFVEKYLGYIEHVVVADEAFFGTVLRNTPFCSTLHNDNFLHIQFDRWENEAEGERDQRKCLFKNRNHCGRSPTTMTLDYLPVLELSGDLFARKFDDIAVPEAKDYIDKKREKDEARFKKEAELMKEIEANKTLGLEVKSAPLEEWEFQGEGVLLVAKETIHTDMPLCMGLNKINNNVKLQPCFHSDVPATFAENWQTGAVIIEEIDGYNRWDIGPCSSDGELKRNGTTGDLEMIPGRYSKTGPQCLLKLGDGARAGRCLDVESTKTLPGGLMNVYPCSTKWHQIFAFGNGTIAPRGAIHATLPPHMVKQHEHKKEPVSAHLCIGVQGRGDANETLWKTKKELEEKAKEVKEENADENEELDPWEEPDAEVGPDGRKSLHLWNGQQLRTTPCSNKGAVIEFFFVPFIVEDPEEDEDTAVDANQSISQPTSSTDMSESDEEL